MNNTKEKSMQLKIKIFLSCLLMFLFFIFSLPFLPGKIFVFFSNPFDEFESVNIHDNGRIFLDSKEFCNNCISVYIGITSNRFMQPCLLDPNQKFPLIIKPIFFGEKMSYYSRYKSDNIKGAFQINMFNIKDIDWNTLNNKPLFITTSALGFTLVADKKFIETNSIEKIEKNITYIMDEYCSNIKK